MFKTDALLSAGQAALLKTPSAALEDQVLFAHMPKTLRKLIFIGQNRGPLKVDSTLRSVVECAFAVRLAVSRFLLAPLFGLEPYSTVAIEVSFVFP